MLKIILKDMPDEFNGIYMSDGKNNSIYVNSKLSRAERTYTVMHELMHYYIYQDCDYYSCKSYYEICNCNWIENKINKKIVELFIPTELIKSIIPYLESYPISEIAEEINVTENLLRMRLERYKNDKI